MILAAWWGWFGGGIGVGIALTMLLGYPLMEGWAKNRYCPDDDET